MGGRKIKLKAVASVLDFSLIGLVARSRFTPILIYFALLLQFAFAERLKLWIWTFTHPHNTLLRY